MTEMQFINLWNVISPKYKNKVKFKKTDLDNGFLNLMLYAEFDVDLESLTKDLYNISNNEVKFSINQTGKEKNSTPCPLLLKSNFNNYFTTQEINELNKLIDINVIWIYNVPNSKEEISLKTLNKLHLMGLNRTFDWLLIVDDQKPNFF